MNVNPFIIENVLVSPFGNRGVRLTPLKLVISRGVDVSQIETKSFGSKIHNNYILSRLSTGEIDVSSL